MNGDDFKLTLRVAVEPIPIELGMFGAPGSTAPSGGGARIHIAIGEEELEHIASRAGAAGDLEAPKTAGRSYFDALDGTTAASRWMWGDWTILLARAGSPVAEVTFGARIEHSPTHVVWRDIAQLPAMPPGNLGGDPAQLGIPDIVFDADEYRRTVRAARALFDRATPRVDGDTSGLGVSGALNTALRQLRVAEGLLAAEAKTEQLATINGEFTNARERWRAIRQVAKAVGVDFEPAQAILAAFIERSERNPGRARHEADVQRLTRQLERIAGASRVDNPAFYAARNRGSGRR